MSMIFGLCFKLDSPNFTSSCVPPFHILLLLLFSFRGPYCNKRRVVVSVRLFFEIHSTKLKQRTKKNDFTLLSFESADMNDLKHSEKINNMAVNDMSL